MPEFKDREFVVHGKFFFLLYRALSGGLDPKIIAHELETIPGLKEAVTLDVSR